MSSKQLILTVLIKFLFLLQGLSNQYDVIGMFECAACPEGCDSCTDDRPCVVSLNWVMRSSILALSCIIAFCLPLILFFTWKYQNIKVSPNKRCVFLQ